MIRQLLSQPGKDIWLMGGGVLAQEFLREDLFDRLELALMPVLIGEGIPLFRTGLPERQFPLTNSRNYPSGIVFLNYQSRRDAADEDHGHPERPVFHSVFWLETPRQVVESA